MDDKMQGRKGDVRGSEVEKYATAIKRARQRRTVVDEEDTGPISQRRMAKQMGLSVRAVSSWESGDRLPQPVQVDKLQEALAHFAPLNAEERTLCIALRHVHRRSGAETDDMPDLIALLVPSLRTSTFWSAVTDHLIEACGTSNPPLQPVVHAHGEDPVVMRDRLRALMPVRRRLAGVLMAPAAVTSEMSDVETLGRDIIAAIDDLRREGAPPPPIVLIDRDFVLPGVTAPQLPIVEMDDVAGARDATEALLALGHEPVRIAGLFDVLSQRTMARRREGFISAIEAAVLPQMRIMSQPVAAPSPNAGVNLGGEAGHAIVDDAKGTDASEDMSPNLDPEAELKRKAHAWAERNVHAISGRTERERREIRPYSRAISGVIENLLRQAPDQCPTACVAATSYIARECQRVMQRIDLERSHLGLEVGGNKMPPRARVTPLVEQIALICLDDVPELEFVHDVARLPYSPADLASRAWETLNGLRAGEKIGRCEVPHTPIIRRATLHGPIPSSRDRDMAMRSSGRFAVDVTTRGRVCIVGEHLDNDLGIGLVAAIEGNMLPSQMPTYEVRAHVETAENEMPTTVTSHGVMVRGSDGNETTTGDFEGAFTYEKDDVGNVPWENYISRVLDQLNRDNEIEVDDVAISLRSALPPRRGLGSSAAITVAIGTALAIHRHVRNGGFPFQDGMITKQRLAEICRVAERESSGVLCGRMDQLSVLFSEPGYVTQVDTETQPVRTTHLPFPDEWLFVLLDTNQQRDLGDIRHGYNQLVNRYREALWWFRRHAQEIGLSPQDPPATLFALQRWHLDAAQRARIPDELRDVCLHALGERERVLRARTALSNRDLTTLASLMGESHRSLAENCKVSTPALDHMVRIAEETAASLDLPSGAKLVGAGFGGVVLCIVPSDACDEFVTAAYARETQYRADNPEYAAVCEPQTMLSISSARPTGGFEYKVSALD